MPSTGTRQTTAGTKKTPMSRKETREASPAAEGTLSMPPSSWMQRPIDWNRPSLEDLLESLPEVSNRAILNRVGRQHPLEADVLLSWPQRGLFSNRSRRDWNGVSIGTGKLTSRPIQPRLAAEAFERTLQANHCPTPEWWESGMTQFGEWWCLRACWTYPNRTPDSRGNDIVRFLYIEHDVRWSRLAIGGGLRRNDGATITATHEGAALTGPLITGARPNRTLAQTVWLQIDQDAHELEDWKDLNVTSTALAAWVAEQIHSGWGPETGPRLLLRNGVSTGRSAQELLAAGPARVVSDDVNQVAWQLGLAALCLNDIRDRHQLTTGVMRTVRELNDFRCGMEGMASETASAMGSGHRQIH